MMKVFATPSIPDRQDQTCVALRRESVGFQHSVETWSVPSLDRPKTLRDELVTLPPTGPREKTPAPLPYQDLRPMHTRS